MHHRSVLGDNPVAPSLDARINALAAHCGSTVAARATEYADDFANECIVWSRAACGLGHQMNALARPDASATTAVDAGIAAVPEGKVPVLFLDYDNVLHPCDAFRTRRGIRPSDPDASLFQFAPLLEDLLSPFPELRIVLSTSWVEVLGFDRARDRLPIKSLRDRVVGATYHSRHMVAHVWEQTARGIQVRRYVARHRLQRWVALDDRDDGFDGAEEHLVKCRPGMGLGDEAVASQLAGKLADICSGHAPS
jgi:hypothetical protein